MEASTPVREDIRPKQEDGASAKVKLPESVEDAAAGKTLSAEQHMDALEWLLADEEDEVELTKSLDINIGTSQAKRWVTWVIKPVDQEVLRSIQQATTNRRQRRAGQTGDIDAETASLRTIVFGTVEPDLVKAAQTKGLEAPDPAWGPMQVVKHRFRHKPGLLDQLTAEIFDISGFDEEDVRESKEVKAAQG